MHDIFLSYNRQDQPTAKRFAEALVAEGYSVWWDTALRSGEAYDEVTEAALRGAKAVVVLWSARSVVSRWVRAEATVADRLKTLVPAMIEACERPIMFELTQTADLSGWDGDRSVKVWKGFVADVHRFVDREAAVALDSAPIPLVPSPIPARGKRGAAPSLAVLPFANRSPLPEDEVFAVGMVEDLIDALSQGVNLRVVASSATARYREGAIPDLEAMARELGVRYVLEGNVRRSGAVLRVTAQLVEADSGEILWTQRFERPLSELAELQEELVLEVASHLDSQVQRMEMARVLRKPADLTAWEACTRAVAAYRQIGIENLIAALTEATRAVEIAPDYGLAHAMLADARATLYMWSVPDGPDAAEAIAAIERHIERALTLEPDNAMVLAHVAEAYNYIGLPDHALRPAKRAIQLSPNFALGHYTAAVAHLMVNQIDEALTQFEAELRAAPGSHTLYASWIWRGSALLRSRDWVGATAAYDTGIVLNHGAGIAYVGKALALALAGEEDDAVTVFARARRAEPAATLAIWQLGTFRGMINSPVLPEVREIMPRLWEKSEGR